MRLRRVKREREKEGESRIHTVLVFVGRTKLVLLCTCLTGIWKETNARGEKRGRDDCVRWFPARKLNEKLHTQIKNLKIVGVL